MPLPQSKNASSIPASHNEDVLLRLIAEGTSAATGQQFFRSLVRHLAAALQVKHVFITECADFPATRVRMLAYWSADQFADNEEYDLANTPCEHVIHEGKVKVYACNLAQHYSDEEGFAESYIGIPIFNADGDRVIGHMALLDDEPMTDEVLAQAVFDIFAARAGAEMQRLHVEKALRESEANYRLLVDHQSDLVIKLTAEGRFEFVSPSFVRLFGGDYKAAAAEFIGLSHPDDTAILTQGWQHVLAGVEHHVVEHRALTLLGWRWLAWSLRAIKDDNGSVVGVVGAGRDVTDRRSAEEQARRHLQTLAHVGRVASLGEMATALAHEVNQPLTAILSFAQACLRQVGSGAMDQADLLEALQRIAANAERAGDIVRQLRAFVRKDDIKKTSVEANALVQSVVHLLEPDIIEHAITLHLDFGANLPLIHADATQIQQVIVNLIRNAVDALMALPPERREIYVRTRPDMNGGVRFDVEDSGRGVEQAVVDRLFDAFVSTKEDGMGIGLSICNSIVEAHGGRLQLLSSSPAGANFGFFIPGYR